MTLLPHIRRLIYSAEELAPNAYQLTIKAVNVVLIIGEEIILIDTGLRGSSAQITDFLNGLGRSPRDISLIVCTHRHIDHMGGLAEMKRLTSAKVALHRDDIIDTSEQSTLTGAIKTPPKELISSAFHSAICVKWSDVDMPLAGGEVLEPLGGLRVIHAPGHTPGSIVLYSEKHRLAIVGDAIRNHVRKLFLPPKVASTDLRQAAESIRMIGSLEFDILSSGHGRAVRDDAMGKVRALIEEVDSKGGYYL